MSAITLVTGGARSGKSRYALALAARCARAAYLATAEACDEEMRQRIARHRAERGGDFLTIEEPVDLAGALRRIPEGTELAVVDCLTVWLGNLIHRRGLAQDYPEVQAFLSALERPPAELVLVSNEVGLGVVPPTELGRAFRDLAGSLNQEVARRAHSVVFLVCGLPLFLKGSAQSLPGFPSPSEAKGRIEATGSPPSP